MKAGHGAQMHSADGSLCRGGNSVACSARTDRPIKEGQTTPGWAGVKQRNLSPPSGGLFVVVTARLHTYCCKVTNPIINAVILHNSSGQIQNSFLHSDSALSSLSKESQLVFGAC